MDSMLVKDLKTAIYDLSSSIEEEIDAKIIDSDEIGGIIADTNADSWAIDDVHVISVAPTLEGLIVRIGWHAAGDQSPDHSYCGDKAEGTATVLLKDNGEFEVSDINGEICDYR